MIKELSVLNQFLNKGVEIFTINGNYCFLTLTDFDDTYLVFDRWTREGTKSMVVSKYHLVNMRPGPKAYVENEQDS